MIRMCCAECFNDIGLRNNIIPTLMPQKETVLFVIVKILILLILNSCWIILNF